MFLVSLLTAAFSKLLIPSLTPSLSGTDLPPLSVKRSKDPRGGLSVPLTLPHTPCPTPTHPSSLSVTKETDPLLHRAESSTSKALAPWVPSIHHPPALLHLQSLPSDSTFLSACTCAPGPPPRYSLQLLPYFLILFAAKLFEGVYTSSSPIRPSTHYAHHTWERLWGNKESSQLQKFVSWFQPSSCSI